jgi:hypothetical protein
MDVSIDVLVEVNYKPVITTGLKVTYDMGDRILAYISHPQAEVEHPPKIPNPWTFEPVFKIENVGGMDFEAWTGLQVTPALIFGLEATEDLYIDIVKLEIAN